MILSPTAQVPVPSNPATASAASAPAAHAAAPAVAAAPAPTAQAAATQHLANAVSDAVVTRLTAAFGALAVEMSKLAQQVTDLSAAVKKPAARRQAVAPAGAAAGAAAPADALADGEAAATFANNMIYFRHCAKNNLHTAREDLRAAGFLSDPNNPQSIVAVGAKTTGKFVTDINENWGVLAYKCWSLLPEPVKQNYKVLLKQHTTPAQSLTQLQPDQLNGQYAGQLGGQVSSADLLNAGM